MSWAQELGEIPRGVGITLGGSRDWRNGNVVDLAKWRGKNRLEA